MTFAIYQDTDSGWLRIGTFTPRKATSVRHIAEQYFAKCPNAPRGKTYISRRFKIDNHWVDDSQRIPLA